MKRTPADFIIATALVAVALGLYWGASEFPFLPFDDDIYVTLNPHLRLGLGFENLRWILSPYESNWIPLTWLSLSIDAAAGGIEPAVFHRTNTWLHAASAAAAYFAIRALTRSRWRSAAVALIFVVHPLHVESVAWVAERKDVLSGLFAWLCLWAYAGYARADTKRRASMLYALVCLLLALGLASKPMLVSLPVLFLLLDAWPLRRWRLASPQPEVGDEVDGGQVGQVDKPGDAGPVASSELASRLVIEKLPFFALAIADAAVTLWAQSAAGAVHDLSQLGLGSRIANASIAMWTYVVQTVVPRNLAPFYPHPGESVSTTLAIATAFALVVTTTLCIASFRRWPHLAVGWGWFAIMSFPVLGLVQVGLQSHADRYMYLPQTGLAIAVVWSLPSLRRHSAGMAHPARHETSAPGLRVALARGLAALGIVWLAAITVRSHDQLQLWRSGVTLFEHTRRVTEPHSKTHQTLGLALHHEGRDDEAFAQFVEAERLSPGWSLPLAAMGKIHSDRGEVKRAHRAYARAVSADPDSILIRLGFARALIEAGQPAAAIPHLRQVLERDDELGRSEALGHLGYAYAQLGEFDRARAQFQAALALDPESAELLSHLAAAQYSAGDARGALSTFQRAIAIAPERSDLRANVGSIHQSAGDHPRAVAAFERAIDLGGGDLDVRLALYRSRMELNDLRAAISALRGALEIAPDSAEVQNDLAWHLATAPDPTLLDPSAALTLAEKVNVETGGENATILDTLAAAQIANGQTEDARATLARASAIARTLDHDEFADRLDRKRRTLESGAP